MSQTGNSQAVQKEIKRFSFAEVQKHNKDDDAWIVVDGIVYNITKFANIHPGGKNIILALKGQDASKTFWDHHHQMVLDKFKTKLMIGQLDNHQEIERLQLEGDSMNEYGCLLPYTEPHWYQGQYSPYYKETHAKWRNKIRTFVETEVKPLVMQYQDATDIPREVDQIWVKAGVNNCILGQPWCKDYLDVDGPEDYDLFHQAICFYEGARLHCTVFESITMGVLIGLPPVFHFGSDYLKNWILPEVLSGKKRICLAISEAYGASDVANMQTVAVKDGDHYVVNGAKKWITGGLTSDYFTVAVRTGKTGMKGLSMLLIEKGAPGFKIKPLNTMNGDRVAYLIFENVRVPEQNLIGDENEGFIQIMYNFNPERLAIVIGSMCLCRQAYTEVLQWAIQRDSFGKKLHNHQAVRMKLGNMARKIEYLSAWTDQIIYQLTKMDHFEAMAKLGDQVCLLKVTAGQTLEFCAREAAHIMGGSSLVRGGPGQTVERIYRTVLNMSITGGAEDVMLDFGSRSLINKAEKAKKKYDKLSKLSKL